MEATSTNAGEVPGFQSPPAARHGTPESFAAKMSTPAKRYLQVLAAVALALVVLSAIGLAFPLRDGPSLWIFSYVPFVGSGVLVLTLPVSLVWLAVDAVKKKGASVKYLAGAAALPVIALAVAIAGSWRILREFFPG